MAVVERGVQQMLVGLEDLWEEYLHNKVQYQVLSGAKSINHLAPNQTNQTRGGVAGCG